MSRNNNQIDHFGDLQKALEKIEKQLESTNLPDGSKRSPDQIAYAAPILLNAFYLRFSCDRVVSVLSNIESRLSNINNKMR